MVLFFAFTMAECNSKQRTNSKSSKKCEKVACNKKRFCRNTCLFCGIVIIILGTVILFTLMEDENWSENSYSRSRILLVACFLFIASTALCIYVMREGRKETKEELEMLVIGNPPSYESVFNEPPPAYIAVIKSIHIIQQETTG